MRNFEKIFNIKPFDFNFFTSDFDKLTDFDFIKYKKIFRTNKNKPNTINDLKIFYKQMIENITGNNLNIFIKKRHFVDGKKIITYTFDEKKIYDF